MAAGLAACSAGTPGDGAPAPTGPAAGAVTAAPSTPSASATTTATTADVSTSTATATTAEPPAPPATTAVPATTEPAVDPASPASCPTPPRAAPAADRPRYRASARIDLEAGLVEGLVDVTFTPDLPVDRLVFRLWPNSPRLRAVGTHLDILATGTDRGGTARLPDPTTLELLLPGPVPAGSPVRATMSYRLVVAGAVRDRVARGPGWLRLGSFLPLLAWEPGRGWALDPPTSGFAEAATSPVADYELDISAPPGLTVLAAGVPDGAGRWSATAVRDVALSVGAFRLAEAVVEAPAPVRVTVGVEATMPDGEAVYLERVTAALVDFAQRYGPYPWPTLTLALTPELGGGIEFPSHVMQGSGSLGRTTPHEVAHQWFYGLVGNDQGRDPVLDEGLATYAEAVHEGTLGAFAAAALPAAVSGLAGRPMTWWEDRFDQYYLGIYAQGAQALAALGPPEQVDCGLRRYVAANAHRLATPADLVAAMATVFPAAGEVLAAYGIG